MAKRTTQRDDSDAASDTADGALANTLTFDESYAFLGISKRQFQRYISTRKIVAARGPRTTEEGRREPSRFWTSDLEELREEEGDDKGEISTVVPVAQLITVMTGLVKQAEDHSTKMLSLIVTPSKELHEKSLETIATLSHELTKMQKKYHELIEVSEKALTKAHERELMSMKALRSEDRLDQLVLELRKYGPHLASGVVGFLKKDRASGLGPLLLELAESMSDEHKAELMGLVMKLPDSGKKAGMRILDQLQKASIEKVKSNGQANGQTNGTRPSKSKPADPSEDSPDTASPELDAMLSVTSLTDEDLAALPEAARVVILKAREAARALKS